VITEIIKIILSSKKSEDYFNSKLPEMGIDELTE